MLDDHASGPPGPGGVHSDRDRVEQWLRNLPVRDLGLDRHARTITALRNPVTTPWWGRTIPIWAAAACLLLGAALGLTISARHPLPDPSGSPADDVVAVRIDTPMWARATPLQRMDVSRWAALDASPTGE